MAISMPILEERKHVIPWNLLETLRCEVNITMENGQISLKISIFFTYTWGTFSIAMFFFYRGVTWRIRPINFVPLDREIGRPDSSCFSWWPFSLSSMEFLSEFWWKSSNFCQIMEIQVANIHTDIYIYYIYILYNMYTFHFHQKSWINQSCVWHHWL